MMIEEDLRGEIFNVCAPSHPRKKEIYTTIAERLGMEKPKFLDGGSDAKYVSSEKILGTGFEFSHEDPMEF
jgi:hypothetical protein